MMKKTFLFLATLYLGIQAFSQNPVVLYSEPYSKSINDPKFETKDSEYLFISRIETSDAYTLINFVFSNTSNSQKEIFLAGENYYILANGERYDIIDFGGIKRGQKTVVPKGRRHPFYVRFEPIPASVSKFDLIEVSGDFDFRGVSLESSHPNVNHSRFTKDYNCGRMMKNGKWDEGYSVANNTFVFNTNNEGDIVRITNDGIIITYHLESIEKLPFKDTSYYKIKARTSEGQSVYLEYYLKESYGVVIRDNRNAVQLFKK